MNFSHEFVLKLFNTSTITHKKGVGFSLFSVHLVISQGGDYWHKNGPQAPKHNATTIENWINLLPLAIFLIRGNELTFVPLRVLQLTVLVKTAQKRFRLFLQNSEDATNLAGEKWGNLLSVWRIESTFRLPPAPAQPMMPLTKRKAQ